MDIKNVLVSAVVAIIAVVVGVTFLKPEGSVEYRTIPQENLGAIPGNNIEGNYLTVGGLEMAYLKGDFATTTNLCLFKNPWNATSTIVRFTASGTNAIAGTIQLGLATSSLSVPHGANAGVGTSTGALIRNFSVGSGAAYEIAFETKGDYITATGEGVNKAMRPGNIIALRVASSTIGSNAKIFNTRCTAVFQKL